MKTSGIVAAVVLGALALGLTVWIGRYQASPDVFIPRTASQVPADPGPEVSKTGPHPKAVADETEHDFGRMSLTQKGSKKFTIRNEGQAELKLLARKEDATCQCTLGELADGNTIPPGESRDVTLSWEIKALVENFRHSAKIRTNDPENRIIEFVVRGRVDSRFKVYPGDIWEVGELSRTEPTKFTGMVFSTVLDAFAFKSEKYDDKKLKVTYEPMTAEALADKEAKCGYSVNIDVLPGAPIGPFSEQVVLVTDDEKQPEVQFQVRGRMSGPIEFLGPAYRMESNTLTFGEFPADKGKEVTLSLFVRNLEGDLQLLGVEPMSDRVQFELKKQESFMGNTQRYILKVRVPPGPPLDILQAEPLKFQLKFNHPESENVKLNVRMLAV